MKKNVSKRAREMLNIRLKRMVISGRGDGGE